MKICSRCIYDSTISKISFDEEGICNYCRQVEDLQKEFKTGTLAGEQAFEDILSQIKRSGKNKKYDCIVGVSGGTDSSYLLMKAIDWGLRPLAVHYDNTWNSSIATMNIEKVTSALNVDLYTYVVNNKEVDDIKKAFMFASVPEFDADTDIAFVQTLRMTAAKYGVKYIIEGHSYIEEGLTPVGANYLDGGYVNSIHDTHGSLKRKTFPNMTFFQFLKWTVFYQQQFIRPLWYINYSKKDARKELIDRTGWIYYGGHHLENRASSFAHKSWLPKKFGIDYRNLTLAAQVRKGSITRKHALDEYSMPVKEDENLIYYVKKRLKLSDDEYEKIFNMPLKSWKDFKTYKKRFEMLRPLFYLLAISKRVPMSFYIKYCFPMDKD
jgi:N-acetyl sugar amidotransferase